MDQYGPHSGATFEGHYSKFRLPSGAHLALIICVIPNATKRPYMISFTYVPATIHSTSTPIFQRELWVDRIDFIALNAADSPEIAFEQRFPEGFVRISRDADGTTEYDVSCADFSFKGKSVGRVQWAQNMETPEGLLVHLPLPLHWHVQSLSSAVDFAMHIKSAEFSLPEEDRQGRAVVHQEKNWASSFPSAHIWIQARNETTKSGICIAGGRILELEAYLGSYRGKESEYDTTFAPPLATAIPIPLTQIKLSPTMVSRADWENRTFEMEVRCSWGRRLRIKAQAPKGSFFGLSGPFPEGHRENSLGQSFMAKIRVEVWEAKGLLGAWECVATEEFDSGSLEFGAAWYGAAGGNRRN